MKLENENRNGQQFMTAVRAYAAAEGNPSAWLNRLESLPNTGRAQSLAKSIAVSSYGWFGPDGAALSTTFINAIAPRSLVDSVKRWSQLIAQNVLNARAFVGVSASVVPEGMSKLTTAIGYRDSEAQKAKAAAVLVCTDEMLRFSDESTERTFNRELERAVVNTMNAEFISMLTKVPAAATGSAMDYLAAGLKAAPESDGYVVAVTPSQAIDLAIGADGRMGITSGDLFPGVHVVAVPNLAKMLVIPAQQFMISDEGLDVRVSKEALLNVSNPGTGATATATAAGNVVTGVSVTAAGSGYIIPPAVVLEGGGGSGATAVAVLNAEGEVTAINVVNPGTGYTSAPTVSFVTEGLVSLFQDNMTGLLVERSFKMIQGAAAIEVG